MIDATVTTTSIEIISGDDYEDAAGRALEWSEAYAGSIVTGDTVTFRCERDIFYNTTDNSTSFEKAGSVTVAGGTMTVKVDLTAAETAAFETGTDNQYKFEVEIEDAATSGVATFAQGTMTVLAKVTEP